MNHVQLFLIVILVFVKFWILEMSKIFVLLYIFF